MRFYFEPNHTVIQTINHRQTGRTNRFVVCKFDENGVCDTEDEKIIHILQTKLDGCTWSEDRVIDPLTVISILSDDEIREIAKEKGIKSWHVKKIDKLRKELGV
jgi:hypothetical protein